MPVSSKVDDVQIWSVEKSEENVYKVVFTVSQNVVKGEESSGITSVYEVSVYVDNTGDMVIIQSPTITGKPAKSDYSPKAAEPDGTVSAEETTEITEFLTTFFTLYPAATLLCQRRCAAGNRKRQLCICRAGESGLYQERRYRDGQCSGAVP